MKKISVIALWFVLAGSLAQAQTIVELSDGQMFLRYPVISGDGNKVSFCGDSSRFPNSLGIERIDACYLTGMDFTGEVLLKEDEYCASYYLVDPDGNVSGSFPLGCVCESDAGPMPMWGPQRASVCFSGQTAVFIRGFEWFTDIGGILMCTDLAVFLDLATGDTVEVPNLMSPSVSGDCTHLAARGYDWNIKLVDLSGTVTDLGVAGEMPVVNEGSSVIAFLCRNPGDPSQSAVCTINADGTGLMQLTPYSYPPEKIQISREGDRVIYQAMTSADPVRYDIIWVNTANGSTENISARLPSSAFAPSISADGQRIMFQSDQRVYLYLDRGRVYAVRDAKVETGWGVVLVFDLALSEGTVALIVDSMGPALSDGFTFETEPRYYHLETTAAYSGGIEVCVTYEDTGLGQDEWLLRLLHNDGGQWSDITSWFSPWENKICGRVQSLSDFAIASGQTYWTGAPPSRTVMYETGESEGVACGLAPPPGRSACGLALLFVPAIIVILRLSLWRSRVA